jgi:hypothetical protein
MRLWLWLCMPLLHTRLCLALIRSATSTRPPSFSRAIHSPSPSIPSMATKRAAGGGSQTSKKPKLKQEQELKQSQEQQEQEQGQEQENTLPFYPDGFDASRARLMTSTTALPNAHGSCVIYWMSRDQRASDNHALHYAQVFN